MEPQEYGVGEFEHEQNDRIEEMRCDTEEAREEAKTN